jgi:hypothetical protein
MFGYFHPHCISVKKKSSLRPSLHLQASQASTCLWLLAQTLWLYLKCCLSKYCCCCSFVLLSPSLLPNPRPRSSVCPSVRTELHTCGYWLGGKTTCPTLGSYSPMEYPLKLWFLCGTHCSQAPTSSLLKRFPFPPAGKLLWKCLYSSSRAFLLSESFVINLDI